MKQKIGILGITGTIGRKTADVVLRNRDLFSVEFVTAHENQAALDAMAATLSAKKKLLTKNNFPALRDLILETELDRAVIAASGTDILPAVFALAQKGIPLAMANKECIVAAGALLNKELLKSGGKIIPVDSEHSAIFQILCGQNKNDVEKLILTASGGPFINRTAEQMARATKADALKHPNWQMGEKITIDSATLMNKGLEMIEARLLFDIAPAKIDAVIHPQSIVHAMAAFADGSVIAQMAVPDMALPVGYALGFPDRISSGIKNLDLTDVGTLSFGRPDYGRFPCLKSAADVLARDRAGERIALAVADEIAVRAFLDGKINWNGIPKIIGAALEHSAPGDPADLEETMAAIDETRAAVHDFSD